MTVLSIRCWNTALMPPQGVCFNRNQCFNPEGRIIAWRSFRTETLICVVKINTHWEDYNRLRTVSFKLCLAPVEPRMARMEGHWCLRYCQLADKDWHCLISLAHRGNLWWWRYSFFYHLLSHCTISQLNEGIWPFVHACARSCIICECVRFNPCVHLIAVCSGQRGHYPAHFFIELTINPLLPFSAHTYSVLLTVCCHMLYCCVCCACCKVELGWVKL